ncbi:uncharacterized protein LOC127847486 isoform X3 [Dreissena polymorpha]|uniref:PDZ domain-containing protein n=1 Tax=Dreissena polymorpha TaxID=45954 RepID=A0A9D4DEF6_DREPO|nr:uncharacterized protein LOC127847486 isoform X3 [Dreissena polymorpha]KAH3747426.1 hypothetical protein DPMN_181853 [Dreissena polymorpha]
MVTGHKLTLTIKGGSPWGFRLQGGGNFPLEVAKIRKNSHSSQAGLQEGDVILAINRYPMNGRSHQSAMDVVEMATDTLVFEVSRTGRGASVPLDPQRHPRIIPMVSGPQNEAPGIVTSAHADYSTTSGDTRTDYHTDEYVLKTDDGRRITKTVTQRTTRRFSGSSGPSPAASHSSLVSNDYGSLDRRSRPTMWTPPSQRSGGSNLQKSQSLLDVHFGHRLSTPLSGHSRSFSQSPARPRLRSGSVETSTRVNKENRDPLIAKEQAKWEATHTQEVTPSYKLTNIGVNRYVPPKVNDPKYPMFDVPKVSKAIWTPPKINEPEQDIFKSKKRGPPVPPKPVSPAPSPIPFHPAERILAGVEFHHPGMIRPPPQPQTLPAPPPPPMPVAPLAATPKFNVVSLDKLKTSTPHENGYGYDYPDPTTLYRPDHLPVFGPKVMFDAGDDSGLLASPTRDAFSDISGHSKKKIFSDSAFYDDSTNRFPTIDEQMSMCKKIAQSLTSYANKRARGARMFAKRRRRSDKWIIEHSQFGSEFSSSTGDVADLNELDSELYYDDGGNKPLFSFRIPKVAGLVSDGQKMSLSKSEFERLRLVAPKVDHHGVSPNQCFSIAADLHKGGKNKGAKLFAKRQQRVEKFVIDESNVMHSPVSPTTKLDFIVKNPQQQWNQKNPWNMAAASAGSVDDNRAFRPQSAVHMPPQPIPRHNLTATSQPNVISGPNFNTKARGWGGSGPGVQQQSYYRESYDPKTGTNRQEWYQHQFEEQSFDPENNPKQFDQFGNYNRKIKAWPESDERESKPEIEFGDYNRRMKGFVETEPRSEPKVEFGDYNRKIKSWQSQPVESNSTRTVNTSYSIQTNYNTVPRGFGRLQQQEIPSCDL